MAGTTCEMGGYEFSIELAWWRRIYLMGGFYFERWNPSFTLKIKRVRMPFDNDR